MLPAEALIRGAVEESRPLLQGREIRVRVPAALPSLDVDAELIRTVLRHLLDNAAKYSSPGTPIQVSAEWDWEGEQVRISVADQGPGLREEELSHVFDKYYRGARTRDSAPGIGMGLAIARDIIAVHGGRIWAESSPGQGARFAFTLPVEKKARG
jgi:signal transduction histidine kinase